MNKANIVSGVKIVMAMTIALVIAFFIPTNPRSAFLFLAKLKNNFLAFVSQKTTSESLAKTHLFFMRQIGKGVYAKEDKKLKIIYVRVTKDAELVEKTIEVNGRKILLQYINGAPN